MQEVTPLADLPAAQAMFLDLLGRLKVGAEERATLAGLWREPWRRYHTAGHAGLLWGRHLAHGGDPDDLVAAHAIAYHDAVYCVGSPDNKSRSVALWRAHAAGLPAELRDSVARAILATADHAADHDDPDACWLVDLDLTPLGEPLAGIQGQFPCAAAGDGDAGRSDDPRPGGVPAPAAGLAADLPQQAQRRGTVSRV